MSFCFVIVYRILLVKLFLRSRYFVLRRRFTCVRAVNRPATATSVSLCQALHAMGLFLVPLYHPLRPP